MEQLDLFPGDFDASQLANEFVSYVAFRNSHADPMLSPRLDKMWQKLSGDINIFLENAAPEEKVKYAQTILELADKWDVNIGVSSILYCQGLIASKGIKWC